MLAAMPAAAAEVDAGRYQIAVVTLGPGTDLFTMFGHTALLVNDRLNNIEKIYNFGEFDYSQKHLAYKFLSGDLKFWISIGSFPFLKKQVEKGERSLTLQTLALTPRETRAVLQLVDEATLSSHRNYRYHHYTANCCTKVRDLLDRALGGLLLSTHREESRTFRYWTNRSSSEYPLLMLFFQLILNRKIDEPITSFDAMYLPFNLLEGLGSTLRSDGIPLVSSKQVVFPDRRKPRRPIVSWALIFSGLAFFILSTAAPLVLRKEKLALNLFALGLCLFGLFSGAVGAILLLLWRSALLVDLHANENLFVFSPTHLIFTALGIAIFKMQSLSKTVRMVLSIYSFIALFSIVLHLVLKVGPLGQNNYAFSAFALGFLTIVLVFCLSRGSHQMCRRG
jgi:hypothetical protein